MRLGLIVVLAMVAFSNAAGNGNRTCKGEGCRATGSTMLQMKRSKSYQSSVILREPIGNATYLQRLVDDLENNKGSVHATFVMCKRSLEQGQTPTTFENIMSKWANSVETMNALYENKTNATSRVDFAVMRDEMEAFYNFFGDALLNVKFFCALIVDDALPKSVRPLVEESQNIVSSRPPLNDSLEDNENLTNLLQQPPQGAINQFLDATDTCTEMESCTADGFKCCSSVYLGIGNGKAYCDFASGATVLNCCVDGRWRPGECQYRTMVKWHEDNTNKHNEDAKQIGSFTGCQPISQKYIKNGEYDTYAGLTNAECINKCMAAGGDCSGVSFYIGSTTTKCYLQPILSNQVNLYTVSVTISGVTYATSSTGLGIQLEYGGSLSTKNRGGTLTPMKTVCKMCASQKYSVQIAVPASDFPHHVRLTALGNDGVGYTHVTIQDDLPNKEGAARHLGAERTVVVDNSATSAAEAISGVGNEFWVDGNGGYTCETGYRKDICTGIKVINEWRLPPYVEYYTLQVSISRATHSASHSGLRAAFKVGGVWGSPVAVCSTCSQGEVYTLSAASWGARSWVTKKPSAQQKDCGADVSLWLDATECELLAGQTQAGESSPLQWKGTGNWGGPNACGCFEEGSQNLYFNTKTNCAANVASSSETIFCRAPAVLSRPTHIRLSSGGNDGVGYWKVMFAGETVIEDHNGVTGRSYGNNGKQFWVDGDGTNTIGSSREYQIPIRGRIGSRELVNSYSSDVWDCSNAIPTKPVSDIGAALMKSTCCSERAYTAQAGLEMAGYTMSIGADIVYGFGFSHWNGLRQCVAKSQLYWSLCLAVGWEPGVSLSMTLGSYKTFGDIAGKSQTFALGASAVAGVTVGAIYAGHATPPGDINNIGLETELSLSLGGGVEITHSFCEATAMGELHEVTFEDVLEHECPWYRKSDEELTENIINNGGLEEKDTGHYILAVGEAILDYPWR